jgi:hypothetical protein
MHRLFGPPAPPRLVTEQSARRHGLLLRIACEPCGSTEAIEGAALPVIPRAVAVGELWFAGRFRGATCRRPASRLELIERGQLQKTLERWGLDEPFVAERLRRHWRYDPYDRRDWPAWFRRG